MSNRSTWRAVPVAILLSTCLWGTYAEELEIVSFDTNGQLVYEAISNSIYYSVQWAPSPEGPWTNFTSAAAALDHIPATTEHRTTCVVPMCYRVMAKLRSRIPDGFVLVEAGTAAGGSPTIDYDFCISKHEVTAKQFSDVMQWALDNERITMYYNQNSEQYTIQLPAEPYDISLHRMDDRYSHLLYGYGVLTVRPGMNNFPCAAVSWWGAAAYCNFLSEIEGREPAYDLSTWEIIDHANGYRLPYQQEWEYAARGGKDGMNTQYSGSNSIGDVAWYKNNSDAENNANFEYGRGTLPVGTKAPNELGLFDMSGNLSEWCHDFVPTRYRAVRGGHWNSEAGDCSVSTTDRDNELSMGYYIGFRVMIPVDN